MLAKLLPIKSKVKALEPGIFKIGDVVKIRLKERASFAGLGSGTVLAVDDEYVYVRAGCDPGIVRKFPRDQALRSILSRKWERQERLMARRRARPLLWWPCELLLFLPFANSAKQLPRCLDNALNHAATGSK